MPPHAVIELPGAPPIAILHEDPSCLAIDKPPGWACAPSGGNRPGPDLERALRAALDAGAPWAQSRNLRFLKPVPALDAETSGVLLLAKTPAAFTAYVRLLEDRRTPKEYLAVTGGKPPRRAWTCCLKVRPDPEHPDRVLVHVTRGQHAETEFEVLGHGDGLVLLVARPRTARPHQIRAHLAAAGLPIVGDTLYGFGREITGRSRRAHELAEGRARRASRTEPLALRAVRLAFPCPFTEQPVEIEAEAGEFLERYGFAFDDAEAGDAGGEEETDEDGPEVPDP